MKAVFIAGPRHGQEIEANHLNRLFVAVEFLDPPKNIRYDGDYAAVETKTSTYELVRFHDSITREERRFYMHSTLPAKEWDTAVNKYLSAA